MGGRAFVPFAPFDHPTLGKVEIGGWKPGVRLNPPSDQVDAIADAHAAFLKDLAARLPDLADLRSQGRGRRGAGIFQVDRDRRERRLPADGPRPGRPHAQGPAGPGPAEARARPSSWPAGP